MQVGGILESALYVADPEKSATFFERLFGFSRLLESERLIALNVAERNVLLLFLQGATSEPFETPGGVIPGHDGSGHTHMAFSIETDEVDAWKERLRTENVPLESEVLWPGGVRSLYFRDPDDHLLELITPGFWKLDRAV